MAERARRENINIGAKKDMEMNEELRKEAEFGRKAKIAEEFFKEFLDFRRENITRTLEAEHYLREELPDLLAELRVMAEFRRHCNSMIQQGEIAEEELRNGD